MEFLPRKLVPYRSLSSMTETMKIKEEGIPNKISSDRASLKLRSEIDASASEASASNRSERPEGLHGEHFATDLPIGTSDAQRRTTDGTTRPTNEVYHDVICENAKCAKRNMKDECEYTVDHIERQLG